MWLSVVLDVAQAVDAVISTAHIWVPAVAGAASVGVGAYRVPCCPGFGCCDCPDVFAGYPDSGPDSADWPYY